MSEQLKNDGAVVLEGYHYRSGERIAVHVEGGIIQRMESLGDGGEASRRVNSLDGGEGSHLPWIAPGLVDLQVNGCSGYDFNTSPLSPETVRQVTLALLQAGVTSYYPTVITGSSTSTELAVRAIAEAANRFPEVAAGVAGIHLEGPYISPEDGPRGAHPHEYVRPPDWSEFSRWQEAAEGSIRILTLSPEWPDACSFITKCVESGVAVSIGHTAASPEQIRNAVSAGASLSTHLGNGTHLMLPRHPNYLWEQLACDELHTCIIADGFHLPPSVLKVIWKVKGKQTVLVSDAVSFSGMAPGAYQHHIGGNVVLTPQGRLHMADNPKLLAGSVMLLPDQVAYLVSNALASFADAWDAASLVPAKLLGLPSSAGLAVGAPADLVLLNQQDKRIDILHTYKNGLSNVR